jgi:hypothetical protein
MIIILIQRHFFTSCNNIDLDLAKVHFQTEPSSLNQAQLRKLYCKHALTAYHLISITIDGVPFGGLVLWAWLHGLWAAPGGYNRA